MTRLIIHLFVYALFAGHAIAQLPYRYSVESPTNSLGFGDAVVGLGDLDGDSFDDFAVGQSVVAAFQPPGEVFVYSGRTGDELFHFVGIEDADGYGSSLAAADVNGDGLKDIVIGAWSDDTVDTNVGRVEVRSGADGSVLYDFMGPDFQGRYGKAVATAGDLNDDGHEDFIVTKPGSTGEKATIYSGLDGSILFQLFNPSTWNSFPDSIASVGDMDGDGMNDLVCGERGVSHNGNSNAGTVVVISTQTGNIIRQVYGESVQAQLGYSVAGGVDLNQDGFPEFMGGAPGEGEEGAVYLYSGIDGSLITRHDGIDQPGDATFGQRCAFVGDVNGDAQEDYVGVSASPGNVGASGYVLVFSGDDNRLIKELQSEDTNDFFGSGFDRVGDLNGDGLTDFIIGARGGRRADVMTVAGSQTYGVLPEPDQVLTLSWVKDSGSDPAMGHFEITGAEANATGFLLFSTAPANLDWQGLTLLIDFLAAGRLILPIALDATGSYSSHVFSLRLSFLDEITGFAQALATSSTVGRGYVGSQGLELLFTD